MFNLALPWLYVAFKLDHQLGIVLHQSYHLIKSRKRFGINDCFALLKDDPTHPSLRLKKIDKVWSVRIGLHYRALAKVRSDGLVWFWIGHHREYEQLLKK